MSDELATDFVRLFSAIEGLTWNPATYERVQDALYPPTRKVHVRVRDIDAVLRAAREGVLPEVSGDVASAGTTSPPAPEVVEVVRGWRTYPDGSASPVERWVRHVDGDWVSLDSERRTSGDILMDQETDRG